MPTQPTASDRHVDAALTNLSVAFMQEPGVFLAGSVFPVVSVPKQSDKFYTYDKDFWSRSEAGPRAPGTESRGSGFALSTDSYFAERTAIHKDVSDPERANADPAVSNLDEEATRFVTTQMLLAREVEWAAAYFTTSIWTGSSTGSDITPGTTWDNANSTPIEDIRTQRRAVEEKTAGAVTPNVLALGRKCYDNLCDHPDILDRIKYTQKGIVTPELLASLFEVDRVVVARAVRNTAQEGATASYARISGTRNALLVYAAPNPGLYTPSGGYTFAWTGMFGAQDMGGRIKRFRIERNESDRIEAENWMAFKVVSALCGAFFSSAVAA